jgi:molecular chaperone GrpE
MTEQQPADVDPDPTRDPDRTSADAVADTPGSGVFHVEDRAAEDRTRSGSAEASGEDVDELRARWQRAVADLDNLRKRYARALDRERGVERNRVAAAFLPVLDNLELALTHAEADPTTIIEGVRGVVDQAVQVLAGLGYPRQDETGVPFDPNLHEVVTVVDDAQAQPGTVVGVLRPGYGTDQAQLRPAAVAVAQQAR